ncbi:hypothetical protein JJB11_19230 [Ramlibacter ginsenosidimutans]|uniref:Tetratricopeptide repeat protein n=1 Tax=Ramlibacter ginsenosidimutans TaxID=502333 RepID=A0A934TVM8_9BURK|nr:hypothetical protein [Ramlibacter ginsenosidimutans]MBK6008243.1 hypothetical protein [Ramlibacter ginsenosidimutans]
MSTRRLLPFLAWLLLLVFSIGARAQAAPEPSVQEIYATASRGDLPGANRMIDEVLAKHPGSAKAHYVKAELAARGQDLATARSELQQAEQLAPGLPFAKPAAVTALRSEIAGTSSAPAPATEQRGHARSMGAPPTEAPARGGFSLGALLIPLAIVVGLFLLMRRRRPQPVPTPYGNPDDFGRYPQQPYPPGPGMPPYGAPGGYPQGYPPREGMGSSLARGLGTGLAVGAGVVAAEEIGRRMFDHHGNEIPPHAVDPANAGSPLARDAGLGGGGFDPGANQDMGGQDFGIQDGGSWDDAGGSFGDAGGNDWDQ